MSLSLVSLLSLSFCIQFVIYIFLCVPQQSYPSCSKNTAPTFLPGMLLFLITFCLGIIQSRDKLKNLVSSQIPSFHLLHSITLPLALLHPVLILAPKYFFNLPFPIINIKIDLPFVSEISGLLVSPFPFLQYWYPQLHPSQFVRLIILLLHTSQ